MPAQCRCHELPRPRIGDTRAVEADAGIVLRRRRDRRNVIGRDGLVQRITCEFHESPGLCLTVLQASRLFGLAEDTCTRVLDELVSEGVIRNFGKHYGDLRRHFVGRGFIVPT